MSQIMLAKESTVTNNVLRSIGEELRRARRAARLALRDLPARSRGRFKASAVGGYERGERSISVERFSQLCGLYGAHPGEVLTAALFPRSAIGAVRVDVNQLQRMSHPDAHFVIDLVQRVQRERGGTIDGLIALRGADIEAVAQTADLPAEVLIERLRPAVAILS